MGRADNRARALRRAAPLLRPVFGLFLAIAPCYAQIVSATLSGIVTDASGAIVPEASVTVTNVAVGIVSKATSDTAGNYLFPHLSPGTYTITVEKAGFKSSVITGITLLVNQQARVDAQLQVGDVATEVKVSGAAPLVETTTASVGTVIGEREVVDLPLNLRRFGALATLVPGTVSDNGGLANSLYFSTMSEEPYVANGARDASNLTLIDGVDSRNLLGGGFGLQPPPDAVQEFKIQTNTYSAAFGVVSGSTINLVTKSGTNEIHGSVYEFLRNDKLDAGNFFSANQTDPLTGKEIPGTRRPKYRRNQFGFAVGGPIRKNKTFWFVNYEGLREIKGLSLGGFIPTAAEKGGDFSSSLTGNTINLCGAAGPANLNFDSGQLFDPATESLFTCPPGSGLAGSTVLAGTPIPGNKITNIDPVAQKALPFIPEPNRPGFPNFLNQNPQVKPDNQFGVRIDHIIGPKDQLFGRYLFGQTTMLAPQFGYSSFPGFGNTVYFRGQNAALAWTHTFGPHLLNEARFGFQRNFDVVNCEKCSRPKGTIESFGIEGLTGSPLLEAIPLFGFSNFTYVGDSPYSPDIAPDMLEKYQDNLTWTHGRHTVVAGADLQFIQTLAATAPLSLQGELYYDGQFSSLASEIPDVGGVSDFADFLLGYPYYAVRSYPRFLNANQAGMGLWNFYAQDDIRIRPNLSLNIGLRYEYRRPPVDRRDNLVTFIPLGPKFSGPGNGILVSATDDALNDSFCTDPSFSYLNTADGRCLVASSALRRRLGFTGRARRSLIFPHKRDFGPRFGLTWRPLSKDKLIVRTGYGIFYDLPLLNQTAYAGNANPIFSPSQIFNTAFGSPPPLTEGVPTTTAKVFVAAGIPPLSQQSGFEYPPPDFQAPRFQEWSFGIQSQLAANWALEVNYIGNMANHLGFLHYYGNQPRPGVGDLQPRRPYPDFNAIGFVSSDANSNYNSLQAKLTKRFFQGLSFLTSYTWSHGFSDNEGDEGFTGGIGNTAPQDDANRRAEYGSTYLDARQRFVFSYVWDLPVGNGKRYLNRGGPLNAVLGGWSASGIVTFQSGFPITVLSSQDFSNTGTFSPRPDRTCNGAGQKTVDNWFNTSCFTIDALAGALAAGSPRFGNSGRNILSGPGLNNWDFALFKEFKLGERFKLQFRSEFFNFFNQAHFGSPNTYCDGSGPQHTCANVPFSTIGQISSAGDPRDIQFALKLSF